MEKTILIDGRPVRFKATGGLSYRYKAQFGREYIADAIALEEFASSNRADASEQSSYDFTKLSLDMLYNILWTLAKTADNTIPPPMEWLDSFDVFPVLEIYAEVKEILENNLVIDRKNA